MKKKNKKCKCYYGYIGLAHKREGNLHLSKLNVLISAVLELGASCCRLLCLVCTGLFLMCCVWVNGHFYFGPSNRHTILRSSSLELAQSSSTRDIRKPNDQAGICHKSHTRPSIGATNDNSVLVTPTNPHIYRDNTCPIPQ